MFKHIRNLRRAFKAFSETYKSGEYKTVNVTYLEKGELLKNKTVFITGGASGIGLSIASKCIEQQAKVLICGRNNEKLVKASADINSNNLYTMQWDISSSVDSDKKLEEALKIVGGNVDILINNAGVAPSEFFPSVTEKEWEKIYNTNSKGTFFMCQLFCNYWKKQKNVTAKKIINISSQGGFVGATYPYRMSKWDIVGLTQGLGIAMVKHNVLVNGIAPGVVRTAMQKLAMEADGNIYSCNNPLNRFAYPEEIAELALFLSSDLSNFIVGQTIVADGGYTIK